MSPNCKRFFAAVAVSGLMAVVAPAAHALLMLSASVNGTNVCASDQNVGCGFGVVINDENPAVNQLGLAFISISGVQVFNSQHMSTYGPPTNILNSSSLQIINTNNFAVDILVAVSATDFVPASFTAFTSGSGTFQNVGGSAIDLLWWDDPTNQQGAEDPNDTPGNLLDSFSFVAPTAPLSFAHNGGPFNVADLLPYSMTLQFHITLPAGAALVSRGQTVNKDVAEIPEPAPLLLFGAGLLLLAWQSRKSRSNRVA
jgi:PEP-CTERM motif